MEKLLVADFHALELHLTALGHTFGAFVLHLLGMQQIHCAIRKLKILVVESKVFLFALLLMYPTHIVLLV
jgi:hypothetical protein